MAEVDIKYRGVSIATMNATGRKTLGTQEKYCDSDIVVEYTKPAQAVIQSNKNATPSETAQEITPSSGYDAMAKVTVGAVSPLYVGSQVPRKSSSDLSASGDTVSVPAGFYEDPVSKSVASGSAGTPTASKGTVSNHAVQVTPSVQNGAGYISGGTKTGNPVSVSASELVSGTKEITSNGSDIDVTNFEKVNVAVPTGGSSKNTQIVQGTTRTNASTLTAIGAELTVSKTGKYDIYYSCFRTNTSASYTWGTRLYIDGTAHGSENTTWTNNQQNTHLTNVSLTAGQKLRVYGRETRGTSYYVCAPMLAIVEV